MTPRTSGGVKKSKIFEKIFIADSDSPYAKTYPCFDRKSKYAKIRKLGHFERLANKVDLHRN